MQIAGKSDGEEYEDSFIDGDEVEGESQQTYSSTSASSLIQSLHLGHGTWDAERE